MQWCNLIDEEGEISLKRRLGALTLAEIILITTLLLVRQGSFLPQRVEAAPTTMQVTPTNSTAYLDETLYVNVTVTDVTNLVGWQFQLYFLKSILNCTSAVEGPLLSSLGSTINSFDILNDFNATHGRVFAYSALLGGGNSANGTGVVATLTFGAISLGTSPLTFQNTKLVDNQSPPQNIPHTPIGGNAIVTEAPVQVIDVYTQRGGTGGNKSSDAFAPQETIFFNASLMYQGAPVPGIIVQFLTYDPHGIPTARTAVTGADGIASLNTTLPSSPLFGTYLTVASANTHGSDFNDTVDYKVGWIINIIQIVTCNCTGFTQTQFPRGTLAYFNITLENISFNNKQLFMLLAPTDADNNPIAQNWISCSISSGQTSMLLGFRIPPWTIPGVGSAFVDAYNKPYWEAGRVAYCPGNYVVLSITGG
jgi:hypothetical protein